MQSFICMNKLLLLKQKPQACWTILFKFGYDTKLNLDEKYVARKYEKIDKTVLYDEKTEFELGENGKSFLTNIWNSVNNNSKICELHILEKIFETLEGGCPFYPTELTMIKDGKISIEQWISIWQLLLFNDFHEAFKYAIYTGFEGDFSEFAKIYNKSQDSWIFENSERNVFRCCLIESLPMFIPKFIGELHDPNQNEPRFIAFPLKNNDNKISTIIYGNYIGENLQKIKEEYDIYAFIHDGSKESFNLITNARKILAKKAICVIIDISGKNDQINKKDKIFSYIPVEEISSYSKIPMKNVIKIQLTTENINEINEFIITVIKENQIKNAVKPNIGKYVAFGIFGAAIIGIGLFLLKKRK